MKKKVLATVGTLTAAAIIGLGFSQSGVVSADPAFTAQDIREKVNSQYPGEITELELDKDSGNPVYEVEIEMNGKEYELAIDGNTAEILKINERERVRKDLEQKVTGDIKYSEDVKGDKEITIKEKENENVKEETESLQKSDKIVQNTSKDDDKNSKIDEESMKRVTMNEKEKANKSQEENKQDDKEEKQKEDNKTNKKAVIGESKAKEVALGQFAGYVEEIELDEDDGRLVYEVEIEGSNGEAEIEIDAYTGKVIVVDIEDNDDDD